MTTNQSTKYKDKQGNVYAAERSSRNGRFIVVRINEGGNRKIYKPIYPRWSDASIRVALDCEAINKDWERVK